MDIAKKPLPFRYQRLSLCIVLTLTRILISTRLISFYKKTFTQAERLSTTIFSDVCSIGSWFSPVHFQGT